MDRLLNRTGGQGYIYCLKVVIQLPPMNFLGQLRLLELETYRQTDPTEDALAAGKNEAFSAVIPGVKTLLIFHDPYTFFITL